MLVDIQVPKISLRSTVWYRNFGQGGKQRRAVVKSNQGPRTTVVETSEGDVRLLDQLRQGDVKPEVTGASEDGPLVNASEEFSSPASKLDTPEGATKPPVQSNDEPLEHPRSTRSRRPVDRLQLKEEKESCDVRLD